MALELKKSLECEEWLIILLLALMLQFYGAVRICASAYRMELCYFQMKSAQKQSFVRSSTIGSHSHSAILSDLSRVQYHEDGLQRKLKHLNESNSNLEEQIRRQQEDIKDQRTVIIYQMGELAKAVANKMTVAEELKIHRSQFSTEKQVQDSIKGLISKFEMIEKQEKMILRVRTNLEKMQNTYTDHKDSLKKILEDTTEAHQLTSDKMRAAIEEKKNQFERLREENTRRQQQMNHMQQKMTEFEQEERNLIEAEAQLLAAIKQQEAVIEAKSKKIQQMNLWEEIIVDKKRRSELYANLCRENQATQQLAQKESQLEMRLLEEQMLGSRLLAQIPTNTL